MVQDFKHLQEESRLDICYCCDQSQQSQLQLCNQFQQKATKYN